MPLSCTCGVERTGQKKWVIYPFMVEIYLRSKFTMIGNSLKIWILYLQRKCTAYLLVYVRISNRNRSYSIPSSMTQPVHKLL